VNEGGTVPQTPPSLAVQQIEDLVSHDRVAALAAAEVWLNRPDATADLLLHQRVRLAQAAALNFAGEVESSARTMREINAWAVEHNEPRLRASSHLWLSYLFGRIGDPALALEHAVKAVELMPADVPARVRAYHLLCLALALALSGSYEEALRRYEQAGALADTAGDAQQRIHILNNLAYTHYEAGNAEEAVATTERLLATAARHNQSLGMDHYDTIARVYTMQGRLKEAAGLLMPFVRADVESCSNDCDSLATALLTLTEIHRTGGDLDQAQAALDRAREATDRYGLAGLGAEVLREQAELHAAHGRFKPAYETFKTFHEAVSQLRAIERETRARTLQALYETTEARRDSALFRELAVRDPLTGLRNRRYVDEHLAGLLLHARDAGSPLTVALLDLDHFKSVNDLRSHDTGDAVLREVAFLIERGIADVPDSLAARLGGEEFLLVLPGHGVAEASALLEQIRRTLADHEWEPITFGIPVTTSIGAATLPHDGLERIPLLQRADERLYGAKQRGRNQVVDHQSANLDVGITA
jgi:two-component system cell cycle response regulator